MSLLVSAPRSAEAVGAAHSAPASHRVILLLQAIGTAGFVAALAYLGVRITGQWKSVSSTRIESGGWFVLSMAIYAISHLSTPLAWPYALRVVGGTIAVKEALKIGLVAQVGKYLPGNVAHFVGRAALGKSVGVKLQASAISTAVEIACALLAVTLLAPGILAGAALGARERSALWAIILVSTFVVAAVIFLRARWRVDMTAAVRNFLSASLCLAVSLFLSGSSAYALLISIGAEPPHLLHVTGGFALAWVTGFLTPGAPGGLGVRETVFVALLGPEVGASAALGGAILHRLVTAAVDAAAGVTGYAWLASGARSKM